MQKTPKWKTHPLTGLRYQEGSIFDNLKKSENRALKNIKLGSKILQPTQERQSYSNRRARNSKNNNDRTLLIMILGFVALFVAITIILKIFEFIGQHTILISSIFIGCAIIFGVYKYKKSKANQQYEKEQIEKGLVKFVDRKGNVSWGTPAEVAERENADRKEAEEELLQNRISKAIRDFEASRKHSNEIGYQNELQGWLKATFPSAKLEVATGASRPDIVIDHIAIEIKGPTDDQAINSLGTKCIKYSQYYTHLVIVLFEPRFSESNFKEVEEGIRRYFPRTIIIRK